MAIYMWREYHPELCFTAEQANSTVRIVVFWTPTAVNLETSTDWQTWVDYTFSSTITLANIWNKIYFRNKSEITTGFSIDNQNFYLFVMTWSIAASWDVTYLLNKNWTTTLSNYCFLKLFQNATSLTTPPVLTATILARESYSNMFFWCTSLKTLPKLSVVSLSDYCYYYMFYWCSSIKLSTTQTWEYQTPYRIPTTWSWATWTNSMLNMFYNTWWTFTWTPSINTTYYTSNTVV